MSARPNYLELPILFNTSTRKYLPIAIPASRVRSGCFEVEQRVSGNLPEFGQYES